MLPRHHGYAALTDGSSRHHKSSHRNTRQNDALLSGRNAILPTTSSQYATLQSIPDNQYNNSFDPKSNPRSKSVGRRMVEGIRTHLGSSRSPRNTSVAGLSFQQQKCVDYGDGRGPQIADHRTPTPPKNLPFSSHRPTTTHVSRYTSGYDKCPYRVIYSVN